MRATFVFADDSSCATRSRIGISRAIDITTTTAAHLRRALARLDGDVLVVDGRIAHVADLIKAVRDVHTMIPILFLAARPEDVPGAATAGANDFALPEATPGEIDLRIRMLSSAAVRPIASIRRIGAVVLDRSMRSLSSDDKKTVKLTPIELALFERLLFEAGRPVARAELERSIWGQSEPGESATNVAVVYVSYLRKKLARLGGVCRIVTHTQVGYALEIRAMARPQYLTIAR